MGEKKNNTFHFKKSSLSKNTHLIKLIPTLLLHPDHQNLQATRSTLPSNPPIPSPHNLRGTLKHSLLLYREAQEMSDQPYGGIPDSLGPPY